MRVLPFVTALLGALALYGLIIERDTLRTLAGVETAAAAEPATAAAEPGLDAAPTVRVVVLRSTAQPVESALTLSGRTEATRQVEIRAETDGPVISEPIAKGTSLSEGDVMCKIDPGTRPATLAEAKAKLAEAETNFRAASRLAERGFQAETTAIGRAAELESAVAEVEKAQKELERLEIRAPFAGLLETDTAELGTLLQSGNLCGTLIALDPIELVGFVPELDVERVTLGAEARARLSSGREVTGNVRFVARSADPLTRTFRVEIEVPNPDNAIRDGLSAEIVIALEGSIGHLVPQSALTLDDSGTLGVRLHVDGVARFNPVSVIRDDLEGIWLGGLPESADVIVIGQDFVTD
ncbi:MAG: efflux RND transporter periplasmic adaptor subunit, partial [Pseudomonadota bacterium]